MALDLLFPHFDELIRTPEDVQRLNEAILQLAVQGKLVPQDPDDEPASEAQRVMPFSSLDPSEMPYPVATGWMWTRLNDVCLKIQDGTHFSPKVQSRVRGPNQYLYLTSKNIRADGIDLQDVSYIDEDVHKRIFERCDPAKGDVLLIKDGAMTGEAGINNLEEEFSLLSSVALIKPQKEVLLAEYLKIFLNSPIGFGLITGRMTGSAIQRIVLHKIKTSLVPIPPLAEQHRIVAKVDQLFAHTRALEASLRQAQADIVTANRAALHRLHTAQDDDQFQAAWHTLRDHFDVLYDDPRNVAELRQAILDLAVRGKLVAQDPEDEPAVELLRKIEAEKQRLAAEGKYRGNTKLQRLGHGDMPFELPWNWVWTRLGAITVSRDGERIPVSKEERSPRAKIYDYYGASGVIDKIDGFLFDKPLLLIGEDGANLINRSTPIAFIARGQYWVNNHAHVLDGISEEFLKYLELHINAIDLKPYVTGTAQPKMNQAKMNSIPIALPPLAEQQRIVAKVDQLMRLCDALEAGLLHAQAGRQRLVEAVLHAVSAG